MTNIPPVYFYIPESDLPSGGIPDCVDSNWEVFQQGIYNWTLQTYIRLKGYGFKCELTSTIPEEGIIIAHRYSLPFNLQPKPKSLLVCIKADYDAHPYAQLHVVQNQQELNYVRDSYYMPHWLQPGLIKRDAARGDKFENIAYFGLEKNLAPQLQEPGWEQELKALGINWQVVNRERWNDYSNIDALVAIRSFEAQEIYTYKPATKLYNAWQAGIPVIVGRDSAFRAELQSELDYLEVTSVQETINAIKRLRDDKHLRDAMVKNGQVRVRAIQPEKLISQWLTFITNIAVPAYNRWCSATSWRRKIYVARRSLVVKENNLRPHHLYPHDNQAVDNEYVGIMDKGIISMMQISRKIKNILEAKLFTYY